MKLIDNFQPDCRKIGFLYTSSEVNSVSTINAAKAYCDAEGIAYVEASINADRMRTCGVMLANALVAFSGALLCHQQRYADMNCGNGMLVMGLASVIIGQVLGGRRGVVAGLLSAVGGSLLYRIVLQLAYRLDMPSYFVKLLSTLIVILALTLPRLRGAIAKRAKKEGARA